MLCNSFNSSNNQILLFHMINISITYVYELIDIRIQEPLILRFPASDWCAGRSNIFVSRVEDRGYSTDNSGNPSIIEFLMLANSTEAGRCDGDGWRRDASRRPRSILLPGYTGWVVVVSLLQRQVIWDWLDQRMDRSVTRLLQRDGSVVVQALMPSGRDKIIRSFLSFGWKARWTNR